MDPVDHMDQVRNCDCIYDNTQKFQVDHMDQVAQEALEDQGHIIQLEHQVDHMDLEVLEDQVAQAAQADPAAQVSLATRMYRQANCHQEFPVDEAVRAALEDQVAQVWQ